MHHRYISRTVALIAVAIWAGCASHASPAIPGPAFESQSVTTAAMAPTIYAFVPNLPPHIAEYLAEPGIRSPESVIAGSATQLRSGGSDGIAVETDNTLYVVVQSRTATRLLTFPGGASGNAPPESSVRLSSLQLRYGYTGGIAVDHRGNFWLTGLQGPLRFPLVGKGSISPNLTLAPHMASPWGIQPARCSSIVTDARGNVYALCFITKNGLTVPGVSEYSVFSGKTHLVRTFYDSDLGRYQVAFISVAPDGTIYLATGANQIGVFAYSPNTGSGSQTFSRHFDGFATSAYISAITTDSSGNVYVVSGAHILVFGPNANGRLQSPLFVITDQNNLTYSENNYGELIALH